MSVYCPYVSSCLYFVFKYVATIVGSCWSYYIPHCFGSVPSDFAPTHVTVVELNWVVLTWSGGDVDAVSGASSDCSPPCFFKIYQGDISFAPVFYCVQHNGPVFLSRKTCHSEA